MPDADDPKLDALALDLMGRSRVIDLKSSADDLMQIIRALQRPIPIMPSDPAERELAMLVQILRERDRRRRLLALVECGI